MAVALKKQHRAGPVSVRFSKDDQGWLINLKVHAKATRRSLSDELKYLAYLGLIGKDNSDLPMQFIEGILQAQEEDRAGLEEPYQWEPKE